jgi:hypothetical protein
MFIFTPNTLIESAKVNANFEDAINQVKHTNAYRVRLERNAAQSIPNASNTQIQYDKVVYDPSNGYNAGTYKYIVPADGIYIVNGCVNYNVPGDGKYHKITYTINAEEHILYHGNAGGPNSQYKNITDVISLKKNDSVGFLAFQDSGSAKNITAYLSIIFLCQV